jgi:sugar/nucleoside kinase (ribokinase family)
MKDYVAAIGHVSADRYFRCLQKIVAGDKFFVRFIESLPGGMAANAASVLSALGSRTYMLTALGSDEYTGMLIDSFKPYGVDTGYVDILPGKTNLIADILTDPDGGGRTIMLHENPDKPVMVMTEEKKEILRNAAFIYGLISDFRSIPGHRGLFQSFKEAGAGIMLDAECSTFASRNDPDDSHYFELADIVSFNEQAALQYAGSGDRSALRELASKQGKIVILTLGARGCEIFWEENQLSVPSYKVRPVDTSGAGDTFNAAFLHALLHGRPPESCARFAAAAASRAILYRGARSGAVPESAVLDFMRGAAYQI